MPVTRYGKNQDDLSTKPDFRYYEQAGVPFLGQPPLMHSDEYLTRTVRVGINGYGVFDLRNPNQKHFGKTLSQVLDRCYANEYELVDYERYNNGVVNSPDEPPAIFVFVWWVEKADTTPENAKRLSEKSSRSRSTTGDVGRSRRKAQN